MKFDDVLSIIQEEEIGKIDSHGEYTYVVHGGEGKIPHIHFFKGNGGHRENEGCLALLYVGYANHGKYHGRLERNNLECICHKLSNNNFWINVMNQWNEANPDGVKELYGSDNNPLNPYHKK